MKRETVEGFHKSSNRRHYALIPGLRLEGSAGKNSRVSPCTRSFASPYPLSTNAQNSAFLAVLVNL